MIGSVMILGVSVATVDEALKAEAEGADYVGVGPIFSTMTKLDAGDAIGLDVITEIKRAIRIPIIAIGGISQDNISSVAMAGADSAAVVSAVTGAKDMVAAVRALGRKFGTTTDIHG
jgi:thiamine-phosphate diphosphorylase